MDGGACGHFAFIRTSISLSAVCGGRTVRTSVNDSQIPESMVDRWREMAFFSYEIRIFYGLFFRHWAGVVPLHRRNARVKALASA
jgi:hypothetical protein